MRLQLPVPIQAGDRSNQVARVVKLSRQGIVVTEQAAGTIRFNSARAAILSPDATLTRAVLPAGSHAGTEIKPLIQFDSGALTTLQIKELATKPPPCGM